MRRIFRASALLLTNILRAAPHTLDKPREETVAAFGLIEDTASEAILARAQR